jgi:hypothetical protein
VTYPAHDAEASDAEKQQCALAFKKKSADVSVTGPAGEVKR